MCMECGGRSLIFLWFMIEIKSIDFHPLAFTTILYTMVQLAAIDDVHLLRIYGNLW